MATVDPGSVLTMRFFFVAFFSLLGRGVGLVTTISFHGHLTFTFPARFPTFLRD
jgi:hypothetical protein